MCPSFIYLFFRSPCPSVYLSTVLSFFLLPRYVSCSFIEIHNCLKYVHVFPISVKYFFFSPRPHAFLFCHSISLPVVSKSPGFLLPLLTNSSINYHSLCLFTSSQHFSTSSLFRANPFIPSPSLFFLPSLTLSLSISIVQVFQKDTDGSPTNGLSTTSMSINVVEPFNDSNGDNDFATSAAGISLWALLAVFLVAVFILVLACLWWRKTRDPKTW